MLVVLLDMAHLLVFEVLELPLVVVPPIVHHLKDRILQAVGKHYLLVVMGDHQSEIRLEILKVVEGHHALQLLAVVLCLVDVSESKLFVEVEHYDLFYVVPLASYVESVGVVLKLVGGNDVAVIDVMVKPLIDFNDLSNVKLHVHEEDLSATPSDHELLAGVELDLLDEGEVLPMGWSVVVDKVLVVMLDVLKGLQHLNEVVDFIDVSDFELLSFSEEEGKHIAFVVELHEGLLCVEGYFSDLVQGRLLSLK